TGMPEMSDQGTTYTMEELTYNFTTRKAKIKHMVTQQSEGILRGENLKMMPDQSINIAGGQYTVCDAEHPHYFLKMTAAKVMTKPNQKTVFGPAYVVVEDVPLPIVLPFGFVPEMPDRASGVLIPTYGEETARGLYLRDLGYSFVFGNYLDLAITGDIYSYGSWSTEITSRYKKRYAFDGNLSLSYSNDITGEKGSADFFQSKNFGVSWSHSQDSKARPGTSFKASVNFSSPSNSKYNSNNISESLQNQVSSSISYSKTWSGMSLSVNALHSQNSRDSSYSITLPNITFSVNRFYPFKQKDRVGKEKIYEKISLSYNTTLQNKINFKVSELDEGNFWNKLQNGMTHNFSIGLPSFNLFKYFQFSPAVSYGMNWYFREKQLKYNEDTQQVESYFTDQFSTFGISQNFSSGISMSTRLYGIFNFGKKSNLQAIRHMITPSISFSYKPEMGTAANGYTSLTYINSDGKEVIKEYNKYSDMIYSPVSKGKTAALSFAIGNNLEAKIKNPQDTTGKGEEKVKLLDQLNFSGSYNFLADSMRLSNISVTASTTIFGKLGINGNATFDPYAINERGIRYNELNIIKEGGFNIARLTNASASLSYSLSADGKYEGNDGTKDKKDTNSDYAKVYYNPVTGEYIPGGWVYYLNPSIPWSLSFNLNYSFSRTYQYLNEQLLIKDNHIQTISISGQVHLTKALNMNFNTGFDLTKLKMTTSQLSATYDLHCFAISVSWVPNGQWESWSFRIAAKASALSDLLQFKKASSYWDN
ncbi:MAG: LPS-assembly protein LptD, partial [Bacteroidales bacterium]|nr:LPS-assembly protein LptD [Bacteroidales bacterium]